MQKSLQSAGEAIMFLKNDRKIDKHNGNEYLYYKLCKSYRTAKKSRHQAQLERDRENHEYPESSDYFYEREKQSAN